jgi:hypothetical protein
MLIMSVLYVSNSFLTFNSPLGFLEAPARLIGTGAVLRSKVTSRDDRDESTIRVAGEAVKDRSY